MPPVKHKRTVNYADGQNGDIINTIHKNLPIAIEQTKNIAQSFKKGTVEETGQTIWSWLKKNITYKRDDTDDQLIRMPNVFLTSGTGDCKSYSLFTASILHNLGIPYSIRYACYNYSRVPSHVYVVAWNGSSPIVIDAANPVNEFGFEKTPISKIDYYYKNIMQISSLSGWGNPLRNKKRRFNQQRMVTSSVTRLNGVDDDIYGHEIEGIGRGKGKFKARVKNVGQKLTNVKNKVVNKVVPKGVKKFADKNLNKLNKGLKKVSLNNAKKGLNKLKNLAKKGGLAPARTAFLALVRLNVRFFATKLDKFNARDSNKLKSFWEKLGGNYSKLMEAVNKGKQKKGLFGLDTVINGIHGIGEGVGEAATAATVATILTAAAPIIVLVVKMLKDKATSAKEKKELEADDKLAEDSGGLDAPGTDGGSSDGSGGGSSDGGSGGGGFLPGGGSSDGSGDAPNPDDGTTPGATPKKGIMQLITENPIPSLAVGYFAYKMLFKKGR
jgi:uncharacterized membrane protein YgcG